MRDRGRGRGPDRRPAGAGVGAGSGVGSADQRGGATAGQAAGGRTAAPRAAPRSAPQEVRLIGGDWRRTRLPVPNLPGLRPTPDRVRETLFNWLGQDLTGWRCLDAFAGTGALGLEAASRGAAAVTLIERHPLALKALKLAIDRLGAEQVRLVGADALAWLRRAPPGSFDLVMLDPPFDQPELAQAGLAAALPLVAPGGWLYLESPGPLTQDVGLGRLAPWRQGRAGAVHYHLLHCSSNSESEVRADGGPDPLSPPT